MISLRLGKLTSYIDDITFLVNLQVTFFLHHEWNAEVATDDVTKKVTKPNYIGALCSQCNINITMKLKKLSVLANNATRCDNHFVLSAITDDFKPPDMILKSGENFLEIEVTPKTEAKEKTCRLCFLDSFNFIGSSLDKLSNSLKTLDHNFEIIKK